MKKILITGGNGMLANAFKRIFENNKNYDVTILGRDEIDIADQISVTTKIEELKPDILINCAAYTKVDLAETEQATANDVNGRAVGELAKICNDKNILFVTYSTDYVFDGENKNGYKEIDLTAPLNAYGVSKEIGEKLVQQNCKNYLLLRTQWLYGKGGKNFVDTIIRAYDEGRDLKIVNDQFGSPTLTNDLAAKTLALIEENVASGIYHITNSETCSWHEFAEYFLTLHAGKEVKITPVTSEEFPRPAKRPHYSTLINTKTTSLRSWKEAVKEYVVSLSS